MACFMSSSLALGLFRVTLFVIVTLSTTCNAQDPSIVGGTEVPPGRYPFFVQGTGCGGSLVLPDVVLTAAHCVAVEGHNPSFKIGEFVIVGNTEDVLSTGAEKRRVISAVLVHPLWDGVVEHGFDFALFQIEEVTLPGLVPVRLNFDSQHPSAGEVVTVMGFGATDTAPKSKRLLEVDLTYVSNEVCQREIRNFDDPTVVISDTMMCAGYSVGQCSGAFRLYFVKLD